MCKSLIAVIVLASLLLTGCVGIGPNGTRLIGSGHMADKSYELSGFTGIAAQSAFNVKVFPGDRYLVEVTTDDNLLDYVKVTVEGNVLDIRFDTGLATTFSSHGAEARITMPSLTSVRLSGASKANIGAGFVQTSSFEGTISGASQLTGYVQATAIRLDGKGASTFTLNGKASTVKLDLGGASKANLRGMTVDKASAVLEGASSATVNPAQSLDYDLRGASHLQYGGSPAIGQALAVGASSATRQ